MKWISVALVAVLNAGVFLHYLTLAQNNNYELIPSKRFFRTFALAACICGTAFLPVIYGEIIFFGIGAVGMILSYFFKRTKIKRTRRAVVFSIVPCLYCGIPFAFCALNLQRYVFIGSECATILFSFFAVKLSEWIWNGFFEKKNKKFIESVAEKMRFSGTKIIAITGSFGKTCCKNILYELLSGTYRVAMSEGNHNTPMGVALSANKLSGEEDYFIAEFGARKKGDITDLCSYFKPDIGIITGICNQHSAVFGSLHVIYEEKFQLAKMTNEGGFCAFGNNLYAKKMHREFTGNKISVGACEDIYAENICRLVGKTTFNLHIHDKCKKITTCLCGKQAIENLILCVSVADKMGVGAEDIFYRAEKIKQIPHRLEYSYKNGIHILDDSYNANTVGVSCALDYLKVYPSPRIVVAQGVVEMGALQKKANIRIGEELSEVADRAILVGINRKAIKRGLLRKNFSGTIISCRTLKGAMKKFKKNVKPGSTVLFQNDVPDIY